MKDFFEFLKENKIINTLISQYHLIEDDVESIDNFFIVALKNKHQLSTNLDTIGAVYEALTPHSKRKKMGEFYTPIEIVSFILDGVGYSVDNNLEVKKLIDISCGTGSFLIQAVQIFLVKFYLKIFQISDVSELSIAEADQIINDIKSNIHGIDINPIACFFCQINIYYVLFDIFKKISISNPHYTFPIFNILNSNVFEIPLEPKFDVIVGNPPYLFIRDIPETEKEIIKNSSLETNIGQYDYYQLFIELGIKFLQPNGKLGYIIPDSILALSHRDIIRKYIYNNTLIKQISYVGSQFDDPVVSNIIIILEREIKSIKREENLIKLHIKSTSNEIFQKQLKQWDYRFLINLNEEDINILHYLNSKFPKLEDLMKKPEFQILLSRGVELTKEGKVIFCNTCNKYFPVPKDNLVCYQCKSQLNPNLIERIILDKIPETATSEFTPFLFQINRYDVKDKKFLELGKPGINYKSPEIYRDRIVIRQLNQNNLICATYDDGSYTSQSLYNLKIVKSNVKEFNNYYLLGLLNSSLLSYYFIKSFGSYKQLFPRILIEKIKTLPIKLPMDNAEKQIADKIRELVKQILTQNEPNQTEKNQQEIDLLVFTLYQINKEFQTHILDSLKTI